MAYIRWKLSESPLFSPSPPIVFTHRCNKDFQVECPVCSRSIYSEEVLCSVSSCRQKFHLKCAKEKLGFLSSKTFKCRKHAPRVRWKYLQLKQFVSIFKSASDPEDKALAMLALSSFTHDPEGMRDLTLHMKDMLKGLRELKKFSSLAADMLKVYSEGQDSFSDMWNHKEFIQVDCSGNGEVLSIICVKDKIISGHSDGFLKVWSRKGGHTHLIQEIQEHSKGITSLAIIPYGDKLYSSFFSFFHKIGAKD